MSELSERVLSEHRPVLTLGQPRTCTCGVLVGLFSTHIAEVTEAAVRETIAADIEAMPLGTAIHRVSGRTMAHAVRTEAARIARGET